MRVAVIQPGLARYRVPVFRELARRPNVTLRVIYGPGFAVPNVAPDGFDGIQSSIRRLSLFGHPFSWQPAHLRELGHQTDVMIASWDVHYVSLLPAIRKARREHVGLILWGHGYSKRETSLRRRLRMALGQRADAVLLYNQAGAKLAVESGLPPERVFVALNSLDQEPIQAARSEWAGNSESLDAFRRAQGIDGPVVLFTSRLERANRIDLLLHALKLLEAESTPVTAVIIGDGEARDDLQRLAEELRITPRVRFLGAMYGEREVAPWFSLAAVFCYPTNIGLSILHAFGYGLPVVTSDRLESQNPEIEALRNGENGLLYRDGDPAALAETLRRLLQDQMFRSRLSAEALRTATELFTIERMVDGFVDAIEFAASQRG